MTIQEMHFDFMQKLNKMDSQRYRDLLVPEIDWKLNEAQEIFVKLTADPTLQSDLGVEVNQRTTDDIRTIVVNQKFADGIIPTVWDEDDTYIASLPDDYWFYLNSDVYASKDGCTSVQMRKVSIVQHDDEHENSPYNRSSFNWREVNVSFIKEGLLIFTDGDFSVGKVCYQYLVKPTMMHNAQDFEAGSYLYFDGTELTGRQDCILPDSCHRDIVDLAVLITSGDLAMSSYAFKAKKLELSGK